MPTMSDLVLTIRSHARPLASLSISSFLLDLPEFSFTSLEWSTLGYKYQSNMSTPSLGHPQETGERRKVRWTRVLLFATIYLSLYVLSFTFYFLLMIEWHMTMYSYDLGYLLANPSIALRTVFIELTRSPSSLFIVVLCSFLLGMATDVLLELRARH